MKNLFKNLDRQYIKYASYAGITVLVTFFVGYAIYQNLPALAVFGKLFMAVLKPVLIGSVIAYLLVPLVKIVNGWFQKAFPGKKWTKTISVFLCMLAIAAAVIAFFVLISQKVITNINVDSIGALIQTYQNELNQLIEQAQKYLEQLNINIPTVSNYLTGMISSIASGFSTVLFGIIFSIYFLIDADNLIGYWGNVCRKILPPKTIAWGKELFADADKCFSGYIRGQVTDAILVGVVVSIVFSIIKMPYAAVIGFITGFGNLIPYFGPTLGYIAVVLANLINGVNIQNMLIGLAVLEIIMLIDGNIINPRLLAGAIQVHPLLVIASLLAGGAIGGILGMLLAVPVGAFLKMQFEKWMAKKEPPKDPEEEESTAAEQ